MSNTKNSLRRSVKSAQLSMREAVLFIEPSDAGDEIKGPDRKLLDSVSLPGAGVMVLTFKDKAKAVYGKELFLKGFSSRNAGDDVSIDVTAQTDSSISLQVYVGGAAADADVTLCIGFHDWKHEYEA